MECILALLAWSMAIGGLRWIFTLRNPLLPGETEWAPLHRDHLRNLLVAVVGFGAFPILAGCVWGDGFIKGFLLSAPIFLYSLSLLAVNGIGLVRDAQGKRREALLARERDEQTQLRLMLSMFGFLVMFSGLAVVWVSTL
jgi:hypothetical protein